MRKTGQIAGVLIVGLTAMALLIGGRLAPSRTLFLSLTTDDPWTNEMALSYGEKTLNSGHRVVVFLNVRAVELAKDTPPDSLAKAQQSLKALQAQGATVFVCPACSARAGITVPDGWIEGVEAGGPETIAIQMHSDTSVLSY